MRLRVLIFILAASGCGRLDFALRSDAGTSRDVGDGESDDAMIAPLVCGPWGAPTRLDALASVDSDWDAAIDSTGDVLVFGSTRASAGSLSELFISTRSGGVFGSPSMATTISSDTNVADVGAEWNPTGDTLYFASTRLGSGLRLFTATFQAGAFDPPTEVAELATVPISSATLSPDELEMYFSNATVNMSLPGEVYRATRATKVSSWVVEGLEPQITVVPEGVGWPSMSPDGLTLYMESEAGGGEIFEAHRSSTTEHFGAPVLTPPFSGLVDFSDPNISRDGRTLFFGATDVNLTTGTDLYTVTRTCQ